MTETPEPRQTTDDMRVALRAVVAAADHAYGKQWRTWSDMGMEGSSVLARALRNAEKALGELESEPDLWHRPQPGPLYWDWRCRVCSMPVADHPSWWARVRRRFA